MNIRRMEMNDVPQVANIEKECFSQPWSENAIAEEIENPFGLTLVAYDDKTIAGFINVRVVGAEIYINNIAVVENYRGMGVAEELLTVMEQEVSSCEFLTLEVRKSNIPAQNLYKKFGYVEVGMRRDFYEKPTEDALIMTKHLTKQLNN
ncbi:MAG: ribosomal protein S18-alanine N-acetyltransferase [Clostridiales bacterium]|nr:ribosomal protein S18-alanine N-acetyltransferase [Clostridiales bacterium]